MTTDTFLQNLHYNVSTMHAPQAFFFFFSAALMSSAPIFKSVFKCDKILASGLTARVDLPRSDERIHLQAAAQASDPESIQAQENILLIGSWLTCQQEIMSYLVGRSKR